MHSKVIQHLVEDGPYLQKGDPAQQLYLWLKNHLDKNLPMKTYEREALNQALHTLIAHERHESKPHVHVRTHK